MSSRISHKTSTHKTFTLFNSTKMEEKEKEEIKTLVTSFLFSSGLAAQKEIEGKTLVRAECVRYALQNALDTIFMQTNIDPKRSCENFFKNQHFW